MLNVNCLFLGGTLGLFAGMSIVSGVEILIWMFDTFKNFILATSTGVNSRKKLEKNGRKKVG